jgi:hypothetical protein
MLYREIIAVYFEHHMEALKTLYWQSAETVIVRACSTGRKHLALEG